MERKKDFGIACIGRQFPYKEEGPSNLLSFLPILRNLLVEEPPSSWRKKMVTIHGHQLLAKLNQREPRLLLRLRRSLFQIKARLILSKQEAL